MKKKGSKWDGIEIGCDLESDSISVFITENEWAMHKYGLEVDVNYNLTLNVTYDWIIDIDKDIAFN